MKKVTKRHLLMYLVIILIICYVMTGCQRQESQENIKGTEDDITENPVKEQESEEETQHTESEEDGITSVDPYDVQIEKDPRLIVAEKDGKPATLASVSDHGMRFLFVGESMENYKQIELCSAFIIDFNECYFASAVYDLNKQTVIEETITYDFKNDIIYDIDYYGIAVLDFKNEIYDFSRFDWSKIELPQTWLQESDSGENTEEAFYFYLKHQYMSSCLEEMLGLDFNSRAEIYKKYHDAFMKDHKLVRQYFDTITEYVQTHESPVADFKKGIN